MNQVDNILVGRLSGLGGWPVNTSRCQKYCLMLLPEAGSLVAGSLVAGSLVAGRLASALVR
jgi:hypothetical protein